MGSFLLFVFVLALSGALCFAVMQAGAYKERLRPLLELEAKVRRKEALVEEIEDLRKQRDEQTETNRRLAAEQKAAIDREILQIQDKRDREFEAASLASRELHEHMERVQQELKTLEEPLTLQSFGLYKPRFAHVSSKLYREHLQRVYERQKELIRTDEAAVCSREWVVEDSAAKGRKMVNEQIKLMLRAFNGECDAAIAKVKFDNAVMLEGRIRKAFEQINKLGQTKDIAITEGYLKARLEELYLTHELAEKVQEEREEQREIKDRMREEAKAAREIEEAQEEAERDERVREDALEKAKRELIAATGQQHDRLEALVTKLQLELQDAIDRKAKAIARAQLTRSGHVYVISNIGSFGEDCYKVGLTRRLDPMERVWELGDASVPFDFDVHAMIFSEDAPALEHALHQELATRAVNQVNPRKEFFRVSLEEIQVAVEKHHGVITFVTVPEAEEYRKSAALWDEITAGASPSMRESNPSGSSKEPARPVSLTMPVA